MSTCLFLNLGLKIMNKKSSSSSGRNLIVFRAHYGTSPEVVSHLWGRISLVQSGVMHKHVLWALLFMKVYSTEHVLSGIVNCNEKTFRKWIWIVIPIISEICHDVVRSVYHYSLFKFMIVSCFLTFFEDSMEK